MWVRRLGIAASFAALAMSGCSSTQTVPQSYSDMRTSRNDRPYRGGAATVPEEVAVGDEHGSFAEGVAILAWFGAFAAAWIWGADVSTSPRPQDWSPVYERPGPPSGR